MTKKHFEAMAEMFTNALHNAESAEGRLAVWEGCVLPFVELAKEENPRFDAALFLARVNYP